MMKRFTFFVILGILFVACTPTTSKEARTALNCLQKLKASTETGVSINNYEQLIIEAKTALNAANSELPEYALDEPADGEFERWRLGTARKRLNTAMSAYILALAVWREKMKGKTLSIENEPGKTAYKEFGVKSPDPDLVLQSLWFVGEHDTLAAQGLLHKE